MADRVTVNPGLYRYTWETPTEIALEAAKSVDAVLFGAVGGPV